MVQFECLKVRNSLVSSTFEEFPFPIFSPCSFLSLQYKEMVYYGRLGKKLEILRNKISLTDCKWFSLNAPGSVTPKSHPLLKSSLFLPSAPVPSSLCSVKKWFIMGGWIKN